MPPTLPTPPSASPDADKPKQYIRTFHGDLEAVKKGGTPALAPLGTQKVTVPAPVAPPPPVAPAPPLAPLPAMPEVPATPAPTVPAEPITAPLETYGGDFTARMKETQATTATVLAAEQDQGPRLVEAQPQKVSRSSMVYAITGGILLIAGGVGAYIAYTKYLAASAPVMLAPAASAPIFVDERKEVSGTGTALLQAIQQSVTSPLAAGAVRLLYLADATTTESVFSALQLPAPGALLRNINGTGSMAGIVSAAGAQSPFFILSVTSYGETFAAMLQWESRMPRDLSKLFPPFLAPVMTATIATTTATTTQTPATASPQTAAQKVAARAAAFPAVLAGFFDTTVANHDVRVYRDNAGRDILLYGYWNQTTLIIARNAAAFAEIVGRLATSRS